MDELQKYMLQQIDKLEHMIQTCNSYLQQAPEGTLRVNKNKNTVQYYWRNSHTDNHGQYIRRVDEKLVRNLAQKDYIEKVLPVIIKTKNAIVSYQSKCDLNEIINVYQKLSIERKRLVTPIVLDNEMYAERWLKKNRANKTEHPYEIKEGILTENGEMVRSKSEKIIADKFCKMGIPYIYEMPLYLAKFGAVYPDFTALNVRLKKEFYWEHMGMMDTPEYCVKAIKKIEAYENNGIYQGRGLIVTYETNSHTLNVKMLENKIKEFLI